MSDISFSGLGSLVLCIAIASFFGMLLFILFIRHILLTCESESKGKELLGNCIFIKACLFPFGCASIGIILLLFGQFSTESNVLIDRYYSWIALLLSVLLGLIYLAIQLKKIRTK